MYRGKIKYNQGNIIFRVTDFINKLLAYGITETLPPVFSCLVADDFSIGISFCNQKPMRAKSGIDFQSPQKFPPDACPAAFKDVACNSMPAAMDQVLFIPAKFINQGLKLDLYRFTLPVITISAPVSKHSTGELLRSKH